MCSVCSHHQDLHMATGMPYLSFEFPIDGWWSYHAWIILDLLSLKCKKMSINIQCENHYEELKFWVPKKMEQQSVTKFQYRCYVSTFLMGFQNDIAVISNAHLESHPLGVHSTARKNREVPSGNDYSLLLNRPHFKLSYTIPSWFIPFLVDLHHFQLIYPISSWSDPISSWNSPYKNGIKWWNFLHC